MTLQQTQRAEIIAKFKDAGVEAIYGKGGFFLRGEGWVSFAEARKRTGIAAPERQFRPRVSAYGDWATVAMISGARR